MLQSGRRGGLMASTPERAVRVRALTGDIVLCSWTRYYSHGASLHPGVEMVPAMTVTMTMTIITKTKYLSAHLKLLMRLQVKSFDYLGVRGFKFLQNSYGFRVALRFASRPGGSRNTLSRFMPIPGSAWKDTWLVCRFTLNNDLFISSAHFYPLPLSPGQTAHDSRW